MLDEKTTPQSDWPKTQDEFITWRNALPEGQRWEFDGVEPVMMQGERNQHAAAKLAVTMQFGQQLGLMGRARVYTDGMAVKLPDGTVYEPDVQIRVGDKLGPEPTDLEDTIVVVEVASPSNSCISLDRKRVSYFQAASMRHVVIIDLAKRIAIHERRLPGGETGAFRSETRFVTDAIVIEEADIALSARLDIAEVFAVIDAY